MSSALSLTGPVLWNIMPLALRPAQWFQRPRQTMAPMSHIMKTLERLILDQLQPMVRQPLTLQFAYQPRLGVETP
ncbi:uncharacterized protein AKAME5_000252300 [Lates japonicus]|uniref:Uncharacterized protein n=1 Tax=Lates japonicus TaxID=270547 RepID=A0AAD3M7E9_LATJO|nr:uncharacterized protein AKAME5_000252300 [Lates japonicus]